MEEISVTNPNVTKALIQLYKASVGFIEAQNQGTMVQLVQTTRNAQFALKRFAGMRPIVTIDVEAREVTETTTTTTTCPVSITAQTTTKI